MRQAFEQYSLSDRPRSGSIANHFLHSTQVHQERARKPRRRTRNSSAFCVERELIPAAAAFGLGVLVWSPLSRGFLSGKYQRGRTAPAGSRLDVHKDTFRGLDNEKNWNLLDVVGRIAEQHETTHSAVSLAWLLARPQTSSIIVGARTEAQLEDNLRALYRVLRSVLSGFCWEQPL
jgi:diketogulonate reductase-like aldo/keto reductase